MAGFERDKAAAVLAEVMDERKRQHTRWGEQNMEDGTGPDLFWDSDHDTAAQSVSAWHQYNTEHAGSLTYRDVLLEEVAEAMAEDDPARLRAELVHVAAVAVQWIEAIDRRLPC